MLSQTYFLRQLNQKTKATTKWRKNEVRHMSEASNRTINQAAHRLEVELLALGYKSLERNTMIKNKRVVTFSCSTEFNPYYIALFWRSHWEGNFAHIYDFWAAGGPTCIIPIKTLFNSSFIKMKNKLPSHDRNSYLYKGKQYYWWRQKVKPDHELAQLVLKYQDQWDQL
jgi:hypothetical protein